MLKTLIIMILIKIFSQNPITEKFTKLICSYDEKSINMVMTKAELINGFKKIDSLNCTEELNIVSLWFTLRRDNEQSKPIILKFENRHQIPEILDGVKQGDFIEFTLICRVETIQRRTKIIQIANI